MSCHVTSRHIRYVMSYALSYHVIHVMSYPILSCHVSCDIWMMYASEISSCNYLARDFGVKAGMRIGDAMQKCPNLIVGTCIMLLLARKKRPLMMQATSHPVIMSCHVRDGVIEISLKYDIMSV